MKNSFLCVFVITKIILCGPSFAQGPLEPEFNKWPEEEKINFFADYYSREFQENTNFQDGDTHDTTLTTIEVINLNLGLGINGERPISNFKDVNSPQNNLSDVLRGISDQQISDIMRDYKFSRFETDVFSKLDSIGQALVRDGGYVFAAGGVYAATTFGGNVTGPFGGAGIMATGLGMQVFGETIGIGSSLLKNRMLSIVNSRLEDSYPALVNYNLTDEERIILGSMGPEPFLKDTAQHLYNNPDALKKVNDFLARKKLQVIFKAADGSENGFNLNLKNWLNGIENDPGGFPKLKWAVNADDPDAWLLRNFVFAKEAADSLREKQNVEHILGNTEENQEILKDLQVRVEELGDKLGGQLSLLLETNVNNNEKAEKERGEINKGIKKIETQNEEINNRLKDLQGEAPKNPRAVATGNMLKVGSAYMNNLTPLFNSETAKAVNFAASMTVATGEMLVGFGMGNPLIFLNGLTQFMGAFGQLKNQEGPRFEKVAIDMLRTIAENQDAMRREMNNRIDNLEDDLADIHRDMLLGNYALQKSINQQTQFLRYEFDMLRRFLNSMYEVMNEILFEINRSNFDIQQTLDSIENKISLMMDYNILTRISILYSLSQSYKDLQYNVDKIALSAAGFEKIYPKSREVANSQNFLSAKAKEDLEAYKPGNMFHELANCAVNGSCDSRVNGESMWEFDIDKGYFSGDGLNSVSCEEYKLFLNNTLEIDASKSLLGAYPEIFKYIKTIAQINKTEESEGNELNDSEAEEQIRFEKGEYPNLTLWETAAGLYLKLYDIVGTDTSDEVYNRIRETQIASIYNITYKIDQFFEDTKEVDFLNTITEAYKNKSELIIEKLAEFIPDKANSKWDKSWFNASLKNGYQILNNSIQSKGCNISMTLPGFLINNETIQLAAGFGKITPLINITISKEEEEQNDYEQQKVKFDKYTINYRMGLKNEKWTLNDSVTQTFYLYNFGDEQPCTILEQLIWGNEESLRKEYEEQLGPLQNAYNVASDEYMRLMNYDTSRGAQEELNRIVRNERYNKEIENILSEGIQTPPAPVYEKKERLFGLYNDGDSHKETESSQRKRDGIVVENEKKKRENTEKALVELRRQHNQWRDAELFKLTNEAGSWTESKQKLRKIKTILGYGNTNNASAIVGIFGVRKKLEREIEKYFSKEESQAKIDKFIKDLGLETKDYILGEAIRKAMGIEGHLCDLDVINMFLMRIITLSYNIDLSGNDELEDNLQNLMKSSDIILLVNKWMQSKSYYDGDISSLNSKYKNIGNIYKILVKSANEYKKKTVEGITPQSGHYFYDHLRNLLSILDDNPKNDVLFNQASLAEPIEPLIEYAYAESTEAKFDALYDGERKKRKFSLNNTRNLLDSELNKHNKSDLVKELSTCIIARADDIRDFDLKQLGIEYLAKCNLSPEQILELYKNQTNKNIKREIIKKLFTISPDARIMKHPKLDPSSALFIHFAFEVMLNPKEDYEVRWFALNYLASLSSTLIKLTCSDSGDYYNNKDLAAKVLHELGLGEYDCMISAYEFRESIVNLFNPAVSNEEKARMFSGSMIEQSKLKAKASGNNYYSQCPPSVLDLPNLAHTGLELRELILNNSELLGELTNVTIEEEIAHEHDVEEDGKVRLAALFYLAKNNLIDLTKTNPVSYGLEVLPESVGNLSNLLNKTLTTLTLNCDDIDRMPVYYIPYFSSVTSLRIICPDLNELSAFIGNFQQLTTLHLSNNSLKEVPETVGSLTKLSTINLSNNNIESLPGSIGNLSSLETLDLRNNSLKSLPDSIGNLVNLKNLFLGNTYIVDDGSPNSSALIKSIIIHDNFIKAYNFQRFNEVITSDTLSENQELTSFGYTTFLFGNELSTLPASIGNLSKLENLDLGYNKLEYLPETLGNLVQLKKLNLRSNNLEKIPDSLGNLINLTTLDLRDSDLTTLPDSIGNLVNLIFLDIGTDNAWDFNLLNELQITEEKMYRLFQHRESALMHQKRFNLITIPESIGKLAKLEYLDLGGNSGLNKLPASIVNCQNLTTLYLYSTALTDLPDSMSKLSKLEILDLGDSNLEKVPDLVRELPSLKFLNLYGNNLKDLPSSLVKNGDKIYLFEKDDYPVIKPEATVSNTTSDVMPK